MIKGKNLFLLTKIFTCFYFETVGKNIGQFIVSRTEDREVGKKFH